MKKSEVKSEGEVKNNKGVMFAMLLAIFGLLLFIALALTLPQAPSS